MQLVRRRKRKLLLAALRRYQPRRMQLLADGESLRPASICCRSAGVPLATRVSGWRRYD